MVNISLILVCVINLIYPYAHLNDAKLCHYWWKSDFGAFGFASFFHSEHKLKRKKGRGRGS